MTFPNITPSKRQFKAPEWPVTSVNSQSGATSRRLWGSRGVKAELSLSYRNITDDQASMIVECYDGQKGPMLAVALPAATWSGASADLQKWMKLDEYGAGIDWYFQESPTVDSVFPGVSTVQVRLVGEIRA